MRRSIAVSLSLSWSVLAFAQGSPVEHAAKGNSQYEAKQYAECATSFDAALTGATSPAMRESFSYSAACCHSLAGNKDAAFKALDVSLANGFRDHTHLLKDTDLTPLHADARWKKVTATAKAAEDKYLANINKDLKALFDADQADRQGNVDWKVVAPRDAERRTKVDAIVKAGGAKSADDWFHAAMVYQHGNGEADIAKAHDFAARALKADPQHGRSKWLFAASKDRLLMRQKKPQLYGTQYSKAVDGQWVLHEVDPSITDAERAKYNVPPLEQAKLRAIQMNEQEARMTKPPAAPALPDAGTK